MNVILGARILDPVLAKMDRIGFLQDSKRFFEEGFSFSSEFTSTPLPIKMRSGPSAFSPSGFAWLVDGVPLMREQHYTRAPKDEEWEALLSSENPDLSGIEGHYVVFRWSQTKLDIYNDQMGLRTLFLKVVDGILVFCTDLRVLCHELNLRSINSFGFASHWLTFNQLNYDALVAGATRLGPGGHIRVKDNKLETTYQPWSLRRDNVRKDASLESVLRPYISPKMGSRKVYLSLSGGIDSRCLACLLQVHDPSYTLYTFGNEADADVRIAREVGKVLGQTHLFLESPDAGEDSLWDGVDDYISKTHCATPVSGYPVMSFLDKLDLNSSILLDGGFGEIGRRQFLNRLVWKRKIRGGTWGSLSEIAQNFWYHRGSVFQPEVEAKLRSIVLQDIRRIWNEADQYTPEDFADLLAVRYRLPNWYGYEQARLDQVAVYFMPFAQPNVIQYLLAQESSKRVGGRIFKKAIFDYCAALRKVPFVKAGTPYPTWLKGIAGNIYVKITNTLKRKRGDILDEQFSMALKKRLVGSLESSSFRAFDAYNHAEIEKSVRQYISGDDRQEAKALWWFSFETWRRCLELEGFSD